MQQHSSWGNPGQGMVWPLIRWNVTLNLRSSVLRQSLLNECLLQTKCVKKHKLCKEPNWNIGYCKARQRLKPYAMQKYWNLIWTGSIKKTCVSVQQNLLGATLLKLHTKQQSCLWHLHPLLMYECRNAAVLECSKFWAQCLFSSQLLT